MLTFKSVDVSQIQKFQIYTATRDAMTLHTRDHYDKNVLAVTEINVNNASL